MTWEELIEESRSYEDFIEQALMQLGGGDREIGYQISLRDLGWWQSLENAMNLSDTSHWVWDEN